MNFKKIALFLFTISFLSCNIHDKKQARKKTFFSKVARESKKAYKTTKKGLENCGNIISFVAPPVFKPIGATIKHFGYAATGTGKLVEAAGKSKVLKDISNNAGLTIYNMFDYIGNQTGNKKAIKVSKGIGNVFYYSIKSIPSILNITGKGTKILGKPITKVGKGIKWIAKQTKKLRLKSKNTKK